MNSERQPQTNYCLSCDTELANALARLPIEDQANAIALMWQIVRVYTVKAGLPPRPEPSGGNVIPLRLPTR